MKPPSVVDSEGVVTSLSLPSSSSSSLSPQNRDEQIVQHRAFQRQALAELQAELHQLDAEIERTEQCVLHHSNAVSAARALVGSRLRENVTACTTTDVVHTTGSPSKTKKRPKQRLWTCADGTRTRHDIPPPTPPDASLAPLAVVYSSFRKRFEAPRQSNLAHAVSADATIVFAPITPAISRFLASLSPGDPLVLLYWFDRNGGLWRPFVRPPRAKGGFRVGVFATRAPNRPSPLGLSICTVSAVRPLDAAVVVIGADLLDETPLVGLRCYHPEHEAYPKARAGWLDNRHKLQPLYYDVVPPDDDGSNFDVHFAQPAEEKLTFIDDRSVVDIFEMVYNSVQRAAGAAATTTTRGAKRLVELYDVDAHMLPVGSFRVLYAVHGDAQRVIVRDVLSGIKPDVCEEEADTDPEVYLHRQFQTRYGLAPEQATNLNT